MVEKDPIAEERQEKNEAPDKEGKSPKKKLVFLLAAMVVISVGAAFALTATVVPGSASSLMDVESPSSKNRNKWDEGYYESGEEVCNLFGRNSRRFIKIQLGIYFKAPDVNGVKTTFEEGKPLFKDAMISLLSSKTIEEIGTKEGKKLLKEEIAEALNNLFFKERDGQVDKVVFITFLTQQ